MFSNFLKLIYLFLKNRKGKKEEVNRMENSRNKENILKNKIMLT